MTSLMILYGKVTSLLPRVNHVKSRADLYYCNIITDLPSDQPYNVVLVMVTWFILTDTSGTRVRDMCTCSVGNDAKVTVLIQLIR